MWLRKLTLLLGLCVALPAAAREFPLCLYGVNNPADLKIIKEAGFSCIQSYKQDPQNMENLAKQATELGLKVVFYPNKIIGTPYEQKAQNWPVLAWYLVDEPDVHHWTRERVQAAHQAAKKAFAKQDTALVIGQGKTSVPFYDLPDVMMMDWYPVPHLQLTSFGDNVRYVKEALEENKMTDHPIWAVVQAFDWKNYKQHYPDEQRIGRFPTREEMRFMSYDAIVNGATGLFYFIFTHKGTPLPVAQPEYWQRVQEVVLELQKFKPILEQGRVVKNPVRLPAGLKMKTWNYEDNQYAVLLNTTDKTQYVPRKLRAYMKDKKQMTIDPYDVWILKK